MKWEQIESKWAAMARRVRADAADTPLDRVSLGTLDATTVSRRAQIFRPDAGSPPSDGVRSE